MRKLKSLAIILFFVANFNCSKDSNTPESTDGEIFSNQVISLDPDNPLLFSLVTKNNEIIEFYGEKDSEGVPLKCNLISVQESKNSDPIIINLDDAGRPTDVLGNDGSAISFNYDNPNDIMVNVIYPNNEYNLSFGLKDYTGKKSFPKKIITNGKRLSKKITLLNNNTKEKKANGVCDNSNLNVKLTKCGSFPGDDHYVFLDIGTDDPNTELPYFPNNGFKKSLNDGIYCFNVRPPKPIDTKKIQKICAGFSSIASVVCIGINSINVVPGAQIKLCATIATASNLAAIPTFIGCEALINALALPCLSLSSSAVEGSISVLDNICNSSILELKPIPSTYYFWPKVMTPGNGIFYGKKTKSFPVSGPFEEIEIELPSMPKINDFFTDPLFPNPETDYVATAHIECLDVPTQATISVVGTDGYTDSLTLELPTGNSIISISVPSAEAGVLDRITLEVGGLTSFRVVLF